MFAADVTHLSAFIAGLLSFLSPCVFPLVPVYAGYLGSRVGVALPNGQPPPSGAVAVAVAPTRVQVPLIANGLCFVVGFSAVFVLFFYVLSALERPFEAQHHLAIIRVSGAVVIVFALQTLGLLRIPALMREFHLSTRARNEGGMGASFLLGMSFAAGWTPCLGVQLGAILVTAQNGSFGGLPFMLSYCAGLAVPFVVVAVLADRMQPALRRLNRHLGAVNLVAGGLMLIFGMLLLTDRVTLLNSLAPQAPFGT